MSCSSSTEMCSSPSKHTTIKRQQTLCTTVLILQSQNLVSENFSPQLGKKARQLGNAIKGFECTRMDPFNPSAIPEDKFLPSTYFLQDSDDSLSEGAHKIPFENSKPTGPPVVQSTADLNEAGTSTNSQAKHTAEETNVLSIVIPTTEKKMSARKCRKRRD